MNPQVTPEMVSVLEEHDGGPVRLNGTDSAYVLMSMDVYRELMGVGSDEEFNASVEAVKRGYQEVLEGKARPLKEVFDELAEKYDVSD